MEINAANINIESSGLGDSTGFSIKTSAAAFQLLSSGLYTNKIRAVVRELSSNAVDAHTMVSKRDIPIEVKLPNALDSQFYVKDFGPGLSHDNIMHMYTTYFDSSKQQSNDYIGGFGVGSKSPFAYTDSFTVESRHGGMRRLYSAFISDDGTPKIAEIGAFPLEFDETTGLTVSMPVKSQDFNAFKHETCDLFQWFATIPNVLGLSQTIKHPEMSEIAPGLHRREEMNWRESAAIRMGNVMYSINLASLKDDNNEKFLQSAHSQFQLFKPLFDVPIGDISVAASRETIAYDKKTKAYLLERVTEAYGQINDFIVTTLKAVDLNDRMACKEVYAFLKKYHFEELISDNEYNEHVRLNRDVPHLNTILHTAGIKADPFLIIYQGLIEPTEAQKNICSVNMISLHQSPKDWFDSTYFKEWNSKKRVDSLQLVDMDLPLTSVYAERAYRELKKSTRTGSRNIMGFNPKPHADPIEYANTVNDIVDSWGADPEQIRKLSTFLKPEDQLKLKSIRALGSIETKTFFGNKLSTVNIDTKPFYYIEVDSMLQAVKPAQIDSTKYSVFKSLMLGLREHAASSRAFLKDIGADTGAMPRMHTVSSKNIDSLKALPNALPLVDVLLKAFDTPNFLEAWSAMPMVQMERSTALEFFERALNPSMSGELKNAKDIFEKTQMGQASAWRKNIPKWTNSDNDRTPQSSKYITLAGMLAETLDKQKLLPAKVFDNDAFIGIINDHYPLFEATVLQSMDKYTSKIKHGIIEELLEYIVWKDSIALKPLFDEITGHHAPEAPVINISEDTLSY